MGNVTTYTRISLHADSAYILGAAAETELTSQVMTVLRLNPRPDLRPDYGLFVLLLPPQRRLRITGEQFRQHQHRFRLLPRRVYTRFEPHGIRRRRHLGSGDELIDRHALMILAPHQDPDETEEVIRNVFIQSDPELSVDGKTGRFELGLFGSGERTTFDLQTGRREVVRIIMEGHPVAQ